MSNSQFNICGELLNLNIESSINYTNLPYIMSGLNVSSSSPPPQSSCAKIPSKPDSSSDSKEFTFPVAGPSLQPTEFPTNVRSMPSRLAKYKENTLSSTIYKRRSIMKPKRLNNSITMDPKEIKKLYTISEVPSKFKPTSLETIFEEPLPGTNPIGKRKLRRSLSCSDGINIAKTRIKNRRKKVKNVLGKRFALKKILLDEFYERLKTVPGDLQIPESVQTNKTVIKDNYQNNAMETVTDEEVGVQDEDDTDI